ncbi:MAG: DUF2284 domain-containing protein [Desulfitobacterium sp.]
MSSGIIDLMSYIKSLGVDHCAHIRTQDIPFNIDFRKPCEQNVCGNYKKNWMCPPAVGDFEELRQKALYYQEGILFQKVYQLEDSFDLEGMQEGTVEHTKILLTVITKLRETGLFKDFLPLNVGPCTACERCSILDDDECRSPDAAIASVESYGIDVTNLLKQCGIPYNNGKNTMSCVSLILI